MDCNKDEATRAKEIAEKKFTAKDIVGAKKFALKAQNLFPGLEGILEMLATLDVYISAENKINGESDWYGILGVEQQADDETVRKQYRKLTLMLHPDKNKSLGAEGAFKLISEAWTLLSDKDKRVAYDQKRHAKSLKNATMTGASSSSNGMNGFYNFTKSTASSARPPKSTTRASHSSTPALSHKPKSNTFWTVCHRCKTQYEYLRVYLNHNLLCPNCHEAFFAVETAPPPVNGSKPPTSLNFSQKQQSSNHQTSNKCTSNAGPSLPNVGAGGADSYNQNNYQWGPFSRTAATASTVAQAANMVQQAYEKGRREREEAQAALKTEEALRRKYHSSKKTSGASSMGHTNAAKRRRLMDDVSASTQGRDAMNQMGEKAAGASSFYGSKQVNSDTSRVGGIIRLITKDVSYLDIRNILMEKSRKEICKKLKEWNSANLARPGVSETGNQSEKVGKTLKNCDSCPVPNKLGKPVAVDAKIGEFSRKVPCASRSKIDDETVETMTINVPDPDFHDFDKDRTERSFEDNQVWAAYDDDDGMPRYYAMIHSVMSLNPFKMRISWLNSKTNAELGPISWVASGFSKTCGDFRVGKYEINKSLNSFSHKVRWSKGVRGAIGIYPRKGDVWALYRNWSPDWNELTADEVIHKYDMVEVLEDYSEELGVAVTPLVKVAGFKTVFHRHLNPSEVRRIPRGEMFRFSHHVPSYSLTGQEAPNAPKGCWELDPAATPVELLQVITDVKEEIIEIGEKTKEASVVDGVGKVDGVEIITNFSKASEGESAYSRQTEVVD